MVFLCPYCQNNDVVKSGKKKNKSGIKQWHKCNNCKRHFVERDGFERMRLSPEIIVKAVNQHNHGISLSKIKDELQQRYNVKVSRWAICKWTKKYSDLVQKSQKQSSGINHFSQTKMDEGQRYTK